MASRMHAVFIEAQARRTSRPEEPKVKNRRDYYRIVFTDGPFVYTVDLHGPPGSVSEDQATDIANAFYERVRDLTS